MGLPLARGEKIGAWSLTEPDAGSDAAGTRTRAEPIEGGWILNGAKTFTTHGSVGDLCVVHAVTDPEGPRHHNIGAFVLEKGMPGFRPGKSQLDFTMTPEGLARGLTPLDLGRQVRSAFFGAEALRQQRGRDEVREIGRAHV